MWLLLVEEHGVWLLELMKEEVRGQEEERKMDIEVENRETPLEGN